MNDRDRLDQARRILAELGVTVDQLQTDDQPTPDMPTVAEYLPRVEDAAGPRAQRTYGTY